MENYVRRQGITEVKTGGMPQVSKNPGYWLGREDWEPLWKAQGIRAVISSPADGKQQSFLVLKEVCQKSCLCKELKLKALQRDIPTEKQTWYPLQEEVSHASPPKQRLTTESITESFGMEKPS